MFTLLALHQLEAFFHDSERMRDRETMDDAGVDSCQLETDDTANHCDFAEREYRLTRRESLRYTH